MAALLVWCLTFAPEAGSRCDVGHKVEKQKDFYGEAKDKPERTKRFPVRIIRFNGGAHGRAISDLRNLTLYDFDSRPFGRARHSIQF
jgi:hypothetical protein